jgi:hypothetical protein
MTQPHQATKTSRRWFVPRFSLAAALLTLTLVAVGLWYWFRVPFEIVHEENGRREVETVCRTWNGTIRHGPRLVYLDGRLSLVEHYRNGVAHGSWKWFDPAGNAYLEAEFDRGKLVSFRSERCEPRLARHLAERTIDDPLLVQKLLQPVSAHFIETPLKDVISVLTDQTGILFELDVRRLEEAGISIDSPVTSTSDPLPVVVALKEVLADYPIAADYRYGTIVITSAQSADSWRDPTGVTTLSPPPGSALAKAWSSPATFQFIETPLGFALTSIEKQHGITFELSRLAEYEKEVVGREIPVTCNLSGLSLRDSLGLLLEPLEFRVRLQDETLVIEP